MLKIFLTNPFETFKSYTYDASFGILLEKYSLVFGLENANIDFDFFLGFNLIENENSMAKVWIYSAFFLGFGFFFLGFPFFNKIFSNKDFLQKSLSNLGFEFFVYSIVFAILCQMFLPFSFKNFILNGLDAENSLLQEIQFGTVSFLSIYFVKESLSFFMILFFWFFLSNASFSDTLLLPKTIFEILDEWIYRKNLEMFSDVLNLKQNKEVQKFQEFFMQLQGILLFILIANVQGMVPYSSTITASLMNTFYIALAIFVNIFLTLIKDKGLPYFLGLFLPSGCPFPLIFLLNPIELISYSFRIISLSVRLFANMMAGHTLMKVIAGFSWNLLTSGDVYIILHYVPVVVLFILTFLEIAVGFIQTYIFIILVYIYCTDIFVGH